MFKRSFVSALIAIFVATGALAVTVQSSSAYGMHHHHHHHYEDYEYYQDYPDSGWWFYHHHDSTGSVALLIVRTNVATRKRGTSSSRAGTDQCPFPPTRGGISDSANRRVPNSDAPNNGRRTNNRDRDRTCPRQGRGRRLPDRD